jgi:hypothetical protein
VTTTQALDADRALKAKHRALADVARRFNRGVGTTVLDWEYLVVTARRR